MKLSNYSRPTLDKRAIRVIVNVGYKDGFENALKFSKNREELCYIATSPNVFDGRRIPRRVVPVGQGMKR